MKMKNENDIDSILRKLRGAIDTAAGHFFNLDDGSGLTPDGGFDDPGVIHYEDNNRKFVSTQDLVSLTSEKTVSDILFMYRALSNIDNITVAKDVIKKRKKAIKVMTTIGKSLKGLEKENLIGKNSLEELISTLNKHIASSETGRNIIYSDLMKSIYKARGLKMTMPAYNLLVVLLINLLKQSTKKPKYDSVADFIQEQNIRKKDKVNAESVRKCYETYTKRTDELIEILNKRARLFRLVFYDLPLLKFPNYLLKFPYKKSGIFSIVKKDLLPDKTLEKLFSSFKKPDKKPLK
jgi:adenylate kinase family enzyme